MIPHRSALGLDRNVPVPTPVPPPSKYVLEPDIPNDGLPVAKHVVPFPVIPIVPAGARPSPGDASSVAPSTCANPGTQPKSAACIAAINTRRIMISIALTQRSSRLGNGRAIGHLPRLEPFQWSQPASVADVAGTLRMPGACAEALAAARSRAMVSNAIQT
jgi:hypothetical protein